MVRCRLHSRAEQLVQDLILLHLERGLARVAALLRKRLGIALSISVW